MTVMISQALGKDARAGSVKVVCCLDCDHAGASPAGASGAAAASIEAVWSFHMDHPGVLAMGGSGVAVASVGVAWSRHRAHTGASAVGGAGSVAASVGVSCSLHRDQTGASAADGAGSVAASAGVSCSPHGGQSGASAADGAGLMLVGSVIGERAGPGPSFFNPDCAAVFHSLMDSTCARQNRLSSSVSTAPESHNQLCSDRGSASSACSSRNLASALRPDFRAAMPA